MRHIRNFVACAVLAPALIMGCIFCGCSRTQPREQRLHEELFIVDVGPSNDLRIAGASVSREMLSQILKKRNVPGLVLQLRLARDVELSCLISLMELARERQLPEVSVVFTSLTIDDLTKPFETNDFIVID